MKSPLVTQVKSEKELKPKDFYSTNLGMTRKYSLYLVCSYNVGCGGLGRLKGETRVEVCTSPEERVKLSIG